MDSRPTGLQGGMSTWQRYKLGQAQFTAWMRTTAAKVVALPPRDSEKHVNLPISVDGAAGESKRSHRETKKAKKAANDDSFDHWFTPKPALPGWLAELENMAETITTRIDPHDVPQTPSNILRDVVALRKTSARFFSAAASGSDDVGLLQSNAAHSQIITVLDGILGKFEALLDSVKRKPPKSDKPGLGVSANDLSNMFSYLEVDEPAAVTDDENSDIETHKHSKARKHTKRARKAKKKSTKTPRASSAKGPGSSADGYVDDNNKDSADVALDEQLVNEYLQIYCLFEDFNTARDYIVERWGDYYYYQDHPIAVDTLAVLTNAAFEFLYHLEQEMSRNTGYCTHFWKLLKSLFRYFSLEGNDPGPKNAAASKHGPDLTPRNGDLDENFHLLFRDIDKHSDEDLDGSFDRIAIRAYFHLEVLLERQFANDNTLAVGLGFNMSHEMLADMNVIRYCKNNVAADYLLFAETELALGLQDALRRVHGRKVSVAVVLCLQLWIDIRHTIEAKVMDVFTTMQAKARAVKAQLERMLPAATGPRAVYRIPLQQRIKEIETFMLRDVTYYEKKINSLASNLGIDPSKIEHFQLLKCEQVWCGLLMLRARVIASYLGSRIPHDTALDSAFNRALRHATPALILSKFSTTFPGIMTGQKSINATDEGDYAPQIAMRKALVERYADNSRDRYGFLDDVPPPAKKPLSPIQTLEKLDDVLTNDLGDILDLDYLEL
ncbi:hypothetical protein B0T22DRAFT_480464 [Podospora appendiculata]|uniref:DUF6604 domain-containing protein n=1 Tax=Podospora appendiculata TaxID=314037 RepID=A0AAE1CD62_9PEZI|nr:hypothetical protein B0T22DRAFT_480464 [Podospora appendiculata]